MKYLVNLLPIAWKDPFQILLLCYFWIDIPYPLVRLRAWLQSSLTCVIKGFKVRSGNALACHQIQNMCSIALYGNVYTCPIMIIIQSQFLSSCFAFLLFTKTSGPTPLSTACMYGEFWVHLRWNQHSLEKICWDCFSLRRKFASSFVSDKFQSSNPDPRSSYSMLHLCHALSTSFRSCLEHSLLAAYSHHGVWGKGSLMRLMGARTWDGPAWG